jgi:hypothetical protein
MMLLDLNWNLMSKIPACYHPIDAASVFGLGPDVTADAELNIRFYSKLDSPL